MGDIIAHRGVAVSADEFREQGNKFFRACKYVEAMKAYNSALDVDPKDAKSYSNRAAAKIELVNQSCTGLPPEKTKTNAYYESAMDDLRECLGIDPGFVKAWARKGKLHSMGGEFQL